MGKNIIYSENGNIFSQFSKIITTTPKKRREYKYICTCGFNKKTTNPELQKCPSCGTKLTNHYSPYNFWRNDYSHNTEYVIIKKMKLKDKECCLEKEEISLHFTRTDNHNFFTLKNVERTNYKLSYSFATGFDIKINDNSVNASIKNIRKATSYFELDWHSMNRENLNREKNIFEEICSWKNSLGYDTYSLSNAFDLLKKYPALEIIYSSYGSLSPIAYIDINNLNKDGTTPYEILGLSKSIFNKVQQIKNRLPYINVLINSIQTMEKTYGVDKTSNFLDVLYLTKDEKDTKYNLTNKVNALCDLIFKYNYDMNSLKKYLANDIYTYQGIASPNEGLYLLRDYVRMCAELNCDFDKYPKSLKLAHDITVKNYNFTINEDDLKLFTKIVKNNENYQKYEYYDEKADFIVKKPDSIEEIIQEAKKLHHCADSYIKPILNNETKLYFMRKKDAPKKPWITIEVDYDTIVQYACFGDAVPSKEEVEKIKEYAKKKNLNF